MIYRDFYHHLLESFSQPVELFTGARKQVFTLYSEQNVLYIRNSKNNIRRLSRNDVDAFITRFEETGSILPRDYQDVTFNSSYLVAVMKYISNISDEEKGIFRFHSQENTNSEQQYIFWLKNHPEGYVLNIPKRGEGKGSDSIGKLTCLHSSRCNTINNQHHYSQPQPFTGGDYFKVCGNILEVLENNALKITQLQSIRRCSRCLNQEKESLRSDQGDDSINDS